MVEITMGLPEPKQPTDTFITGSSLVPGIVPADKDLVCLFDSMEKAVQFAVFKGVTTPDKTKESSDDVTRFVCAREGNVNYICTADKELFYRFKALSGVLALLQEKDKDVRIKLAQACLYREPTPELKQAKQQPVSASADPWGE